MVMDWSVTSAADNEVFSRFAPAIKVLPRHTPLQQSDLLVTRFRLHSEPHLEIYYAPFDYVNEGARVALVGITPGWSQMERSFRAARDALQAESQLDQAAKDAKQSASFAGKMRETLTAWLDAIDVPLAVGVPSSTKLFGDKRSLLHTTSVVRYPVFVDGGNYSGHKPSMLRHPVLRVLSDVRFSPDSDASFPQAAT